MKYCKSTFKKYTFTILEDNAAYILMSDYLHIASNPNNESPKIITIALSTEQSFLMINISEKLTAQSQRTGEKRKEKKVYCCKARHDQQAVHISDKAVSRKNERRS